MAPARRIPESDRTRTVFDRMGTGRATLAKMQRCASIGCTSNKTSNIDRQEGTLRTTMNDGGTVVFARSAVFDEADVLD